MASTKTPETKGPDGRTLAALATVQELTNQLGVAEAAIFNACSQLENLERGAALATLKAYLRPKGPLITGGRKIGDGAA